MHFRFLFEDEFNELSDAKRKDLQSEFNRIRPDAYEAALNGEVSSDS